ncbi:hypothetical protein NP572_09650 [Pseudomonas putida]|uniref:hypothetical protein n=1 Tax=Pseudomonas putida TaxID=303 RepID=UPI002363E973|nr:hypothetical protein [Pseudomonas putida]MDD2037293.1 hypothetical protein [Pseudomonas putida]MDD2042400.1 hypothetical protein [Pseudomonas putida]
MQPRFVIVPGISKNEESFRVGVRFYAATTTGGYDIYDNLEKVRIKRGFNDRASGEMECAKMNSESRNPDELFPLLRTD